MAERILVVDDEPGVRSVLQEILADEGFEVESVGSGEECLEVLGRSSFDAMLLDIWLPGMDGLATLKRLRELHIDTQVVMISGHGTIDTAVNATKLGAFDFVEKPLSLERTLLVLRNALRQRKLENSNRHLLERLDRDTEILGTSSSAEALRRNVETAAQSSASVLISGSAGVGRETIARRIHATGSRADGPFVDVPCAALDTAAAEPVLFGGTDHPGRLQLAAGGTLFLDDVDRLGRELQGRLAAALSGAMRAAPGLRVMASAQPDTKDLDPGLRQVLEVVRIDVPDLRQRREDIPRLARRFMRELSREYGREPKRLSPDCLTALKQYDWPGNLRELSNLMERLLLFVSDEEIHIRDLPQELGGTSAPLEDLYREFSSLEEGVRCFESYYVRKALAEEGGNKAGTARRLGISPSTLGRILKRIRPS